MLGAYPTARLRWAHLALLALVGCDAPEPPAPEAEAPVCPAPCEAHQACRGGVCRPSRTTVAAGWRSTCVLRLSGEVWCWGANGAGELGAGPGDDRSAPARVAGLSDAVQIDAAGPGVCAVLADGRVSCWGHGLDGANTSPQVVAGIDDAVEVDLDDRRACARRRAGEVTCWELSEPEHAAAVSSIRGAVDIAVARGFVCGRTAGGLVACARTGSSPTVDGAARWVTGVRDAAAFDANDELACAVRAGGEVVCWDLLPFDYPHGRPVPALSGARRLAIGSTHVCAALRSGRVRCVGRGDRGQLGDGHARLEPPSGAGALQGFGRGRRHLDTADVVDLEGVVELAAGEAHTCAVTDDEAVWCWGLDDHGQLGRGGRTALDVEAVPGVTDAIAVAAGRDTTCAVRSSGELVCWGAPLRDPGATGVEGATRPRPIPEVGLVSHVVMGAGIAVVATREGSLLELGGVPVEPLGEPARYRWDPVTTLSGVRDAREARLVFLSTRARATCAIDARGRVACASDRRYPPSQVLARHARAVPAGAELATITDGFCWLRDDVHAVCLGGEPRDGWGGSDGGPSASARPSELPPLPEPAVGLAGDGRRLCAVLESGRVSCLGGDLVALHGPDEPAAWTEVPGLELARRVAVSGSVTCAVRRDGAVDCVGPSPFVVGMGAPPSGRRIEGIDDADDVTLGADYACVLRRGGAVACWGDGEHGQVDGDRPVAVRPSRVAFDDPG